MDVDNKASAFKAVTHRIGMEHRRIGFVSNAPLSYAGAQDRFAGYRQALTEHDIPLEESLVRPAAFLPESAEAAVEDLLALPERPTAIFAASDVVAIGVMSAIQAAGLSIPDDVAVVGFDDIFLAAHTQPALTTIRVPAYGLGWTAAEMLIQMIEGDEEVSAVTLETELVIRDSCGAKERAKQSAGG